ncbi:hypothetical protein F4861DRAFT_36925 [Xylaria intraflava]|nr:hypothetical protein F4861DRAFT_36925 [Xylaria intraflava]
MPYNTTAIPPRKEVTGQTQLPLSRVKKIVAQDQDINICSNNAAFVITLATVLTPPPSPSSIPTFNQLTQPQEMFIQYLAGEGLSMAKLERKPRRNIQYKDLANAVSHQDNLEFLEDIIPKTVSYRQIKANAAATRANLSGGTKSGGSGGAFDDSRPAASQPNGKKHKGRGSMNGSIAGFVGANLARIVSDDDVPMGASDQLQEEGGQPSREDGDVVMAD